MKDIDLREALVDMGIIRVTRYGVSATYGITIERIAHLQRCVNGIAEYLGMEFETNKTLCPLKKKSNQSLHLNTRSELAQTHNESEQA